MPRIVEIVFALGFLVIISSSVNGNFDGLLQVFNESNNKYHQSLHLLITEIAFVVRVQRCFVIITDDMHQTLYSHNFFENSHRLRSFFILRIDDAADLYAPNYKIVRVLEKINSAHCDYFLITLLNGQQVARFLRFLNRHRILNMQQNFIFLYDERLLEPNMRDVWINMVSSIFLKPKKLLNSYTLSTVAYPNILESKNVITKNIFEWHVGKKINAAKLFPDRTINFKGIELPVAVFTHIPMVKRKPLEEHYTGLEIDILRSLGTAMNFRPNFYEIPDSNTERWGRALPNGSFTGLLGQLTNRSARIAIGDLHPYSLYSSAIDFSWPHSYECLTFLTPESSRDDTWKTLISPFSGAMWTGVILSLFLVGTIFYTLSLIHAILLRRDKKKGNFLAIFRKRAPKKQIDLRYFKSVHFRSYLNRMRFPPSQQDLFDNFSNCILLTYSMLMYVALPREPRNWPLRVLTGWYWIYCILVTATYRASFTAILANPAQRITIDTLDELLRSHIGTSTWGVENKELFEGAFDVSLQDIGSNLEITNDIEGVADRIAKGKLAYYDNVYYLRYLRSQRSGRSSDEVLHIMRDCVLNMPVVLGLEKNSPLKSNIDTYLLRMREGGLMTKWLRDSVRDLKAVEGSPQEALMDLKKFWTSFVALAFGYFLSICAIIGERLHFVYVVQKHPLYDEFNTRLYYNFKRRYSNL